MQTHLSFAQVCAKGAGIEIVQVDGLYMTKALALAAGSRRDTYAIVRQQLRATQDFVVERFENPSEKPFELMRLPYDVRHLVLEHLVDSQNIRVFLRNDEIPIRLPEAARAGSVQLRRECLLVALKTCTIEIHSGPGNAAFQRWLSKINFTGIDSFCETGFDAITSLTFPYFSRFPYHDPSITKNNDVGLALACSNLRSLSINFHPEELSKISGRHWEVEGEDAAQCALDIRESYQLDGLLDAANLENLRFVTGAPGDLLIGLAEVVVWFNEGFEKRGQKVLVEII